MPIKTVIAIIAFSSVPLLAQDHKLGVELRNLQSQSEVQVIVQYSHDPTDADHQKLVGKGAKVRGVMHSIKSGSYSMPGYSVAELEQNADITHVSINHKIRPKLDYVNAAIYAPLARQTFGVNGAGIGVAVIDSGISHDTDFGKGSRIVYEQDFAGGGTNASSGMVNTLPV